MSKNKDVDEEDNHVHIQLHKNLMKHYLNPLYTYKREDGKNIDFELAEGHHHLNQLFDSQGFTYAKIVSPQLEDNPDPLKEEICTWNCVRYKKSSCKAQVLQSGLRFEPNGRFHRHPSDYLSLVLTKLTPKYSRKFLNNPNKSFEFLCNEFINEENLPNTGKLRKRILDIHRLLQRNLHYKQLQLPVDESGAEKVLIPSENIIQEGEETEQAVCGLLEVMEDGHSDASNTTDKHSVTDVVTLDDDSDNIEKSPHRDTSTPSILERALNVVFNSTVKMAETDTTENQRNTIPENGNANNSNVEEIILDNHLEDALEHVTREENKSSGACVTTAHDSCEESTSPAHSPVRDSCDTETLPLGNGHGNSMLSSMDFQSNSPEGNGTVFESPKDITPTEEIPNATSLEFLNLLEKEIPRSDNGDLFSDINSPCDDSRGSDDQPAENLNLLLKLIKDEEQRKNDIHPPEEEDTSSNQLEPAKEFDLSSLGQEDASPKDTEEVQSLISSTSEVDATVPVRSTTSSPPSYQDLPLLKKLLSNTSLKQESINPLETPPMVEDGSAVEAHDEPMLQLESTISGRAAEDLEKELISPEQIKTEPVRKPSDDGLRFTDYAPDSPDVESQPASNGEFQENTTPDASSSMKPLSQRHDLPAHLLDISDIHPSPVITRKIFINNQTIYVNKLIFAPKALEWCFRDTLLQNVERNVSYRPPKQMDKVLHDNGAFPFSVNPSKTMAPNSTPLPYPLTALAALFPRIRASRKIKRGPRGTSIATILMHPDPMEWAFTKSSLSSKPMKTDLFKMDTTDHMYPFIFPKTQKYKNSLLLEPLKVQSLDSIMEEGVSLPPVRDDMREQYENERSYLVNLLAAATYYIYYSQKKSVKADKDKYALYVSIARSFQPLIVEQANTFARTVYKIREQLLAGIECPEDKYLISSLIYGPVNTWHHFFHIGMVKKLIKNGKGKGLLRRKAS